MKTIALTVATALTLGAPAGAHAVANSSEEKPVYAASAAYAEAAQQETASADVAPQAIPAVAGVAFVGGAAAGAGKVVAGWAAKKVIGRWVVPATLTEAELD